MHCEYIISSLQDKLVIKQERIGGLEEKLVQMSLELASAKASEDEHRLFRRQMTGVSITSVSSGSSSDECSHCNHPLDTSHKSHKPEAEGHQGEPSSSSSELIVDYNPIRRPRRKTTQRPELSASWSGRGAALAPPGSIPHVPSVPVAMGNNSTKGSESPKPLRNFGLGVSRLAKRMSGVISNSDHPLDDSMASTHDSSRELAMHCFARCESTPASVYNREGRMVRKSSSMHESLTASRNTTRTTTARRTSAADVAATTAAEKPRPTRKTLLQKQHKQSSITDIGQFFLGRGNNNNNNSSNRAPDSSVPLKFAPQHLMARRDSVSSSRSGISGVVFPVTSNDCLVGLNGREDVQRPIEIRSSYANNEEWPSF